MDIFSTIEMSDLPEDCKYIGMLHYREWLTMRDDIKDQLDMSERSYYRKKEVVRQLIVKKWQSESQ